MIWARRLTERISLRARAIPAARSAAARVRSLRHERRVRSFLRAGTGQAGRLPRGVVYEATMRCNLRCQFCYVGDLLNREGEWREELDLGALRDLFPDRRGLQVSLTGGEVFVRRDILEVLDLFRRRGYTCGYLTTNGTLVDEKKAEALAGLAQAGFLRHISVSIDGPKDLHDAARGIAGTFERTAAGLRRLQQAARRAGAPLRVTVNTTIARESLGALDRMVDVADELGVDAIGLNHLMFSTPEEVEETARLTGAPDRSAIATFVTEDPGVTPAAVRQQVGTLRRKCRERNIRFDHRPKVTDAFIDAYYTPGRPLAGRCLYPFLHARVSFSGRAYFCPFIRIPVGDLTRSSLEEVWSGRPYVDLRRRLLEQGLFAVCRRCCKVELR
jgi:MoaA/NifB/PqqE/SkfB family radical SAM enzyme